MALPLDTAVESAFATIEAVLNEDVQARGRRQAVYDYKELVRWIESQPGTGYDALAQDAFAGLDGL